ncbi:RNA-guided endonuclease InsQ/TnpB family protein [Paucibacter soli]|uniref:RNA-guided endonuclease InsQ/TnpB family protein n=1 Tax=Paucibacter soli TaxID=3133433 RepID=UPI0030A306BB
MLIRQGFQYALRLKAQREAVLRRWVGCRRFVFNEALAHQRAEVAAGRKRPGYVVLCARLPELKKLHPWLGEPPAQALQQALKDLCKAWDAKFTSKFGAPRFKKKGEGDTLRLPQDCRYDAATGTVSLPKLGSVRLRHSRQALGDLKNVTLRQERGRWVASLQTEREVDVGSPTATAAVGLDFGAATTIMPSNASLAPIELPSRIGRYERRMKRLQQQVSRKKKGSANRKKAVARLNACHGRIAAMRRDFLHQHTTALVRGHALVAIEDLSVKSMTASSAGTLDAPGKNVRAKSGLNRTILRNGWSMARTMLEYKAAWSVVMLVAVPPAYTSQACSSCGHTAPENRKTQALFECVACGHAENADRNAARNILAKAQQQLSSANSIQPGGCPTSTPGHCGELTPVKARPRPRTRPRSAAQGGLVEPPLAGTISGLSLPGNLHL